MKLIKLMILSFFCVACTEKKINEFSQNITETQKIFTKEIEFIFENISYQEIAYYNSVGAEYVIFKIKSQNMSLKKFNDIEIHKIKKRGWIHLNNQGSSYIYCKDKKQLEISIPKNIVGNAELQYGDILRQNETDWNITFYKPKKIDTLCSI